MSVQVKKKFEELVTYLGKDTKGLEKVKQLKDAVNELRKKLAAAEEKLEQMEAVKDAARERADAAESRQLVAEQQQLVIQVKLGSVMQELTQIRQLAAARRQQDKAELAKMRSVLRATISPVSSVEVLRVLRRLKETMPVCVSAVCAFDLAGGPFRNYNRHELAAGWSDDELWRIGAAVSLLSAHYGAIAIIQAQSPPVQSLTPLGRELPIPPEVLLATELINWADSHDKYRECTLDTLLDGILSRGVNSEAIKHERESQEVR